MVKGEIPLLLFHFTVRVTHWLASLTDHYPHSPHHFISAYVLLNYLCCYDCFDIALVSCGQLLPCFLCGKLWNKCMGTKQQLTSWFLFVSVITAYINWLTSANLRGLSIRELPKSVPARSRGLGSHITETSGLFRETIVRKGMKFLTISWLIDPLWCYPYVEAKK